MNYNNLHPDELKNIIKQCQIALQRKESNETIFIKENPNPKFKLCDMPMGTDDGKTSIIQDWKYQFSYKGLKPKENYIFEATLIPSIEDSGDYRFYDPHGKVYYMLHKEVINLFRGLLTGEISFTGQGFRGNFTYHGNGSPTNGGLYTVIYKGTLK